MVSILLSTVGVPKRDILLDVPLTDPAPATEQVMTWEEKRAAARPLFDAFAKKREERLLLAGRRAVKSLLPAALNAAREEFGCSTNGLHLSKVARARCNTKNALVLKHLWLVDQCVRALRVQGPLVDDATQDGRIALMKAAERHELERGTPFAPYARMFVVGAIKSCLSTDSMSHCTGIRVANEKPAHVALDAARNVSVSDDERLREIDAGDIARAAVSMAPERPTGISARRWTDHVRALRRAAISMLSGVNATEHARCYGIPRQTASDHYRKARVELCKMFR